MITTVTVKPGITLHCYTDSRFKQNSLSVQFLRPMRREEAGLNALVPSILLRGCESAPDLREITRRLDDLYGAAISPLVRQIGDYQTTGFYCSFIPDRFSMDGEAILSPMISFLEKILFQPALESGVFRSDYVESEKRNLILTLESLKNDKRAYASNRLMQIMCQGDSCGISRLGEIGDIEPLASKQIYDHYGKILRESPAQFFYVGEMSAEKVKERLLSLCSQIGEAPITLQAQTGFFQPPRGSHREIMDVTQGRICMGFSSSITIRNEKFPAMQVLNSIFGGGMTSKLFMNVREKQSLCYDISSVFRSSKGIITVSAGVDKENIPVATEEILKQLDYCRNGEIAPQELEAAKLSLISSLQGLHDTPGGIEDYYTSALLTQCRLMPEDYLRAVEKVDIPQVVEAAKTLKLHTQFYLRGK